MSLMVKFPYDRGQTGPLYECSTCRFSTRFRVLFERHAKRCSTPLPAARVSRNYNCERCAFATNKSRGYLLHLKQSHGQNFTIYVCNRCEYASRHKSKMFRHRQQVHKEPLPITHMETLEADPAPQEAEFLERLDQNATDPDYELSHAREDEEEGPEPSAKPTTSDKRYQQLESGDFVCQLCSFSTKFKSRVLQHLQQQHQKSYGYICSTCNFCTDSKEEWVDHATTHAGLHACDECSYTTPLRRNMERHAGRHHLRAPFACRFCSYSATSKPVVNRHMAQHHLRLEGPPQQSSPSPGEEGTPAKCELCGAGFKSESRLRMHMVSHSKMAAWSCPMCTSKYKRPADLNRHMKRKHGLRLADYQKMASVGEDKHPLDLCTKMDWQDVEDGPLDLSSTPSSSPASQPDNFPCPFCDYMGKSADDMQNHLDTHTKKCSYCGAGYTTEEELTAHLQSYHHVSTNHHGLDLGSIVPAAEVDAHGFLSIKSSSPKADSIKYEMESEHEEYPDPMASLAALVDGKSLDEDESVDPLEENNNVSPLKKPPQLESCYLGGNWEISEISDQKESAETQNEEEDDRQPRATCPVCGLVDFPSVMKAHIERHSDLRKYKCSRCGKRSNWPYDIRRHIRMKHGGSAAEMIELSEDEARDTLADYVSKHRIRRELYISKRKSRPEPSNKQQRPDPPQRKKKVVMSPPPKKPSPSPGKPGRYRRFKCAECGKRSNWRWDLNKHIHAVHGMADIIEMTEEQAKETYHEVLAYKSPATTPQKENTVYECSNCGEGASKMAELKKHMMSGTACENAEIKAVSCRKKDTTPTTWTIKQAEQKAPPEKPKPSPTETAPLAKVLDPSLVQVFKCSACHYKSTNRATALSHKRMMHPGVKCRLRASYAKAGGPSAPKEVEPVARSTPKVESAEGSNLPWRCSKCSFQSKAKNAMLDHMRACDPDGTVFTCKVCGERHAFRSACLSHLVQQHGLPKKEAVSFVEEPLMQRCSPEDVSGDWRCLLCGIDCRSRESILQHVQQVHPGDEPAEDFVVGVEDSPASVPGLGYQEISTSSPKKRLYRCNLCPFQASKSYMEYHLRSHVPSPTKPYRCPLCPYYLTTSRLLKQHMRVHDKGANQEEEAEHLSDSIPERTPLKMTLKKEDKKMRYLCDKCPMVSHNPRCFMYHRQLHRPRQGRLRCVQCPYWTASKNGLSRHMKCHAQAYIRENRPDLLQASSPAKKTPVKSTPALERPSTPEPLTHLPVAAATPCKVDPIEETINDVVEMARSKQQVIASKVASVPVTPCKLESAGDLPQSAIMPGVVVGTGGRILKAGPMRKLHRCRFCPYTNARLASLHMHERMHQARTSGKEVFRCQYCSYQAGNKGLLSMHIRVHSQQYQPGLDDVNDVEDDTEPLEDDSGPPSAKVAKLPEKQLYPRDLSTVYGMDKLPAKTDYYVKYNEATKEHVLERALHKKWCCEKCPYASMKKSQFEKHALLHGSAQKYTCEFCDYSVPGYHLLLQHKKLHLSPNPHLLSVQSISNLQKLPTIPADIAAAGNFDPEFGGMEPAAPCPENPQLYENSSEFAEPRKMFRCDRCPYTNSRRDMLLSHMRFHFLRSELQCSFCDYSVSKVHLLNQHIRIHFNLPGNEMSPETPPPKTGDLVPQVEAAGDEMEDVAEDEANDLRAAYRHEDEECGQAMDLSMKKEGSRSSADIVHECRYCSREFTDPMRYERHVRQHLIGVPMTI